MSTRLHSSAVASHTENLIQPSQLAQYLHDELMQLLAIALFHLDAAHHSQTSSPDAALLQGRALVKEALDVTRKAVRSLCSEQHSLNRPLEQMLREITEDVCRISLRQIQIRCDSLDFTPPHKLARVVGQAARELLINACKHAPMADISADLGPLAGQRYGFILTIQDNGPGFDPASLNRRTGGGYGLARITQSLDAVGAVLRLLSNPGGGVIASIQWTPPQVAHGTRFVADAVCPAGEPGAL